MSAAGASRPNDFDVNAGVAQGPRGGYAAGATVQGPRGNEVGAGAAVGPNGGVAAARGVEGAGGRSAVEGVAAGPGGRVAGGAAVRGPNGAAGAGFVAGPHGYAAGFAGVSPSARYATASAVRGNFNGYGMYHAGWYTAHPGAWFAAGWTAGRAWTAATWATAGAWCDCDSVPVSYNYGDNVTYENNDVYVNGQDSGTAEQYYDQAQTLANTGTDAQASSDAQWLPLGVFAFTENGQKKSNLIIQLAVNKQGIVRGNYTDTMANTTQLVHGSVDKKTQRVAFTVGDNKTTVVETGLYDLTKDEAPALLHLGPDRTEQWLLVRLKDQGGSATQ